MSMPISPTVNFKTITKTKTRTKTKFLKDPTCAIFLKSWGFKDIKYDTSQDQTTPDQIRSDQIRLEQRRLPSRGPNSKTCALVEKQMIYANAGFNSNHLMIIRANFLVLAHGPIWNLHPCFPRCVFSSLFYLLWVKTIKVKNILVELS